MASPLREPAALHDRAIQDLSFIRRTMGGASSFPDAPGGRLVAGGTGPLAVAGPALASAQPTAMRWLAVWLGEAFVGAGVGSRLMLQKMRRRSGPGPMVSPAARKFLLGFWPAILAGAILTVALADRGGMLLPGSRAPEVLPGLWLLLYGVG